ncbi:hypothetical protein ACH4E7_40105 [Kitasatospora sp. NPDC018058]|uniref:hypothetical protein n=1 Tax=Kitasatospora sp. NPDC018058 TaxID=3364025 RepID=UPI0037BFDD07
MADLFVVADAVLLVSEPAKETGGINLGEYFHPLDEDGQHFQMPVYRMDDQLVIPAASVTAMLRQLEAECIAAADLPPKDTPDEPSPSDR